MRWSRKEKIEMLVELMCEEDWSKEIKNYIQTLIDILSGSVWICKSEIV